MKGIPFVYCICRIDKKYWVRINEDLKKNGYQNVRCFVPTVQLTSGCKNKKPIIKKVPLLFNFGFIRMKADLAYNRNFLFHMKKNIPGILGFVKSPESMHPKKKKRRVDNAEDFDDFSIVATVTRDQFRYYQSLSIRNKIYNLEDIKPKIGEFVTLKNYPFEGILAKIIDFNYSNHIAKVEIYPSENSTLTIQVPFDSVFYTIYSDFDDEIKTIDNKPNIENINTEQDETN